MIEIHGLTKTFNGFTAVRDVSLEVKEGEIFAFLGPNGAGKTTAIKMLTTLLRPTSGTIRLNGIDPTTKQDEARKLFGIVFQDPSVDDELTAQENLEIHGALYHVRRKDILQHSERLLKLFELWERRNDPVKQFSGGMRRRLEVARSLLHTPRVIFLDEPTLGLDPQTRNQLWSHVRELNREDGVTVFLTTHYMEEAERVAERVAIIDRGSIAALGTPEELKRQTGSATLEEAFLTLTGTTIREEEPDSLTQMRNMVRVWRGNNDDSDIRALDAATQALRALTSPCDWVAGSAAFVFVSVRIRSGPGIPKGLAG